MPVTRSRTRAAVSMEMLLNPAPDFVPGTQNGKRPLETEAQPSHRKKARTAAAGPSSANSAVPAQKESAPAVNQPTPVILNPIHTNGDAPRTLVPAKLIFSFEEAKQHLIRVDPRFDDVFGRLKCKPFEHLEQFDPFSTLASSILGQQISWKAARAITYRFVRLFNPSLPEKPDDYKISDYFPTAQQVANMDHATLKSAGLSGKKAEYVLDLATRFADERLTTEKLLQAQDEELYEMLIAVRGIGKWTVDMFAIFSLRRPDILPVGDLGVQRGLVRWFLSLHSPSYHVTISPDKLPRGTDEDPVSSSPTASSSTLSTAPPTPSTPVAKGKGKKKATGKGGSDDEMLPTPFTPSINRTLNMKVSNTGKAIKPPALPVGLTVPMLKGRLDSKKKVKGAFLTPREMEDLTASWRPYRSLGVYYMWALAESTSTS